MANHNPDVTHLCIYLLRWAFAHHLKDLESGRNVLLPPLGVFKSRSTVGTLGAPCVLWVWTHMHLHPFSYLVALLLFLIPFTCLASALSCCLLYLLRKLLNGMLWTFFSAYQSAPFVGKFMNSLISCVSLLQSSVAETLGSLRFVCKWWETVFTSSSCFRFIFNRCRRPKYR